MTAFAAFVQGILLILGGLTFIGLAYRCPVWLISVPGSGKRRVARPDGGKS